MVMLNHLLERVRCPTAAWSGSATRSEVAGPNDARRAEHLVEFRLELGLPVWRYEIGAVIEKRI